MIIIKIKQNEGKIDRIIRFIIGIILLFAAINIGSSLSIIFYFLAAISFITSITGFCGIYALFKINTNKIIKKND